MCNNNRDTTIPDDAKFIASIYYQGKDGKSSTAGGYYYYEYRFYPKGKNKYIVQKSKELDVGYTALYVEPTIIYMKIVKASDINKIEQEIQNDISAGTTVLYTYYHDDIGISCSTAKELFDKLF